MKLKLISTTIPIMTLAAILVSCEQKNTAGDSGANPENSAGDGTEESHDDHGEGEHDHGHEEGEEVSLGQFDIDGIQVEAAQGHGNVEAGKESHLIIKLPYKDDGETVLRAWIGTSDRTMSSVGKGQYAPSHDDYDIHAIAPDPLPGNAKWWLEITQPDGTEIVGSLPLLKDVQ